MMPVAFVSAFVKETLERESLSNDPLLNELDELAEKLRGFDERIGVCSPSLWHDREKVIRVGISFMADKRFSKDLSARDVGTMICRKLGLEQPERDSDGLLAADYSDIIKLRFLEWD